MVHCVRGEHSTSCFSDSLRLQSASMTGVKQARATRCAAEPSLRDGMSVQEASRCRQEQSWCRAGERGDRRIFQGWQPRRSRATSEVDKKGKGTLCRLHLLTLSLRAAHRVNAQGVNGFLGSFVVSSPFSPRVLARSLLEKSYLCFLRVQDGRVPLPRLAEYLSHCKKMILLLASQQHAKRVDRSDL